MDIPSILTGPDIDDSLPIFMVKSMLFWRVWGLLIIIGVFLSISIHLITHFPPNFSGMIITGLYVVLAPVLLKVSPRYEVTDKYN